MVDLDGHDRATRPRGLKAQLLPAGDDERYLEPLNACFGGWDRRACYWYHRRPFAGVEPDVLVLSEGGRWVSGMGLNYRRLSSPGGASARAAILTAGWTRPELRGRGYFQELVAAAARVAGSRGCALLVGFVTADNASNRGMAKAGAVNVPAWYVTQGARERGAAAAVRPAPADAVERLRARRPAPGAVRFEYERVEDWRAQFLERLHPTEVLAVGDAALAVVERVDATDRLQLLAAEGEERPGALAALAARARRQGRRFFTYSTRPETAAEAARHGLAVKPGCVTVLGLRGGEHTAAGERWASLAWDVESGDRM